jgi:hypothetical protein
VNLKFHPDVDLEGSIVNPDDARIFFNDRLKKAAFRFKVRLARIAGEKIAKDSQRLWHARSRLQLPKGFNCILKTWCVVEGKEIAKPKSLAGNRFSRHRANSDLIVLREGRNDRRFSMIYRSDDGKGGDHLTHRGHLSKPT